MYFDTTRHITRRYRAQAPQAQLLRQLISSQQPAAQQLLQALVARVKDAAPGAAEPRPNSRSSLTGSGGKPTAAPADAGPAAATAVAALQALIARQAAAQGAALGVAEAPPVVAPEPRHNLDQVLQFLLDYVPEQAQRLPGPATGPLGAHLEQVTALIGQQRPGLVTYLTHVMAPPTNAAGVFGWGCQAVLVVDGCGCC